MVVGPIPDPPTMKLHVLSDLHTEFADFDLPETDADVVVLAGDVGVGRGGLEWLLKQRLDKPVVYVPGNHEFYCHDIPLMERLRSNVPPDVHVLDNQSVVIEDVRFLGSILWTDFQLFGEIDKWFSIQRARQCMNDFAVISLGRPTVYACRFYRPARIGPELASRKAGRAL